MKSWVIDNFVLLDEVLQQQEPEKKKDETKLIEFFINPFQANIPILYPL